MKKVYDKKILWLSAGALILICLGLMWGLPHIFDFAQDSAVPMGELASLDISIAKVTAFRYPPFHFLLLWLAFLPAHAIVALTSANDTVRATLFILSARLVSVAMTFGILAWIYAIAKSLWDKQTAFWATLIFLLSPLTLYYAKNANLDIPYTFWLAGAFYFYIRSLQTGIAKYYVLLGLLAALAVCTKDQAYGFILLMPIPLLMNLAKDKETSWRDKIGGPIVGGVVFAIVFIAINLSTFGLFGFKTHVITIVGPASEAWRLFQRGPTGQARLLIETILRLMDAWTVAGVLLVVMGIVYAFRQKNHRFPLGWLLIPALGYYLGFLAIVGYAPTRFVFPIMLPLSLFAGLAVTRLWQHKKRAWRVVAAVLVIWVGLAGLSLDWTLSSFERRDAQAWMRENIPSDAHIYYFGSVRDMPRFTTPYDPQPLDIGQEHLRVANPQADWLIVSLPQGEPGSDSDCIRPSSEIRRLLGTWGMTPEAIVERPTFFEQLLAGKYGYTPVKFIRSPISRFVPEVSESANRTIIFLTRKNQN